VEVRRENRLVWLANKSVLFFSFFSFGYGNITRVIYVSPDKIYKEFTVDDVIDIICSIIFFHTVILTIKKEHVVASPNIK
jgi:hypothetical protein